MQITDQLCLTLLAAGNAALLYGRDVCSAETDALFNLNLTGTRSDLAGLEMPGGLRFREWLDLFSPERLVLVASGEFEDKVAQAELTRAVVAGFEGTSDICLAAIRSDQVQVIAPRILYPPETDLTQEEILRFLDSVAGGQYVRQRLEMEGFLEEVEAVSPDFLRTVQTAFSNTTVSDADRQAWRSFYQAHRVRLPPLFQLTAKDSASSFRDPSPVSERLAALRAALERNLRVAEFYNEKNWAAHFRSCINAIDTEPVFDDPVTSFLVSCGMAAPAVKLIACLSGAWVFGGMGSWNDVPFAEDIEYKPATAALLEECRRGLIVAADRGFGSSAGGDCDV